MRRCRRAWAAIVTCVMAAFVSGNVQAQAGGEIPAEVRRITAAWPHGRAPTDPAQLQVAIESLGKVALKFVEVMDRALQAGGELRERPVLLEAYRAVSEPLEAIYDQTGGQLEKMVQKVIEEDGDLEALYESPDYKQRQVLGAQALYYLNWVRFYGARLFPEPQRKALFEKAANGFSTFLGGDKSGDLQRESLLGRGLCALELGEFAAAIEDLQAVADDPQNPAERRNKARLALLDGLVRHGRYAEAVRVSAAMTDSGDPRALFLRARALLELSKKSPAPEAERQRKEALALLDRVRRAGSVWDQRAQQLLLAVADDAGKYAQDTTNPRARLELVKIMLQKKQFAEAARVLQEMSSNTKSLSPALATERHYLLGLALFQQQAWEQAANELDQALAIGELPEAAEAAYLRFKAREKLAAEKPEVADSPEYERAVRAYAEGYPQHRLVYEAYFRLGELLQRKQRCTEALPYFRKVTGDPDFSLRARFAALQCQVSLLGTTAPPSEDTLRELGSELRSVSSELAEAEAKRVVDRSNSKGMRAKLTVLQAAWESWQPEPNWPAIATALANFEEHYPEHTELFAGVARLRLLALAETGRFLEAERQAQQNVARLLAAYGREEVEKVAVKFIRAGTARRNAGDADADRAAQRAALALYKGLADAGQLSETGELTLARLYENTGNQEQAEQLYRALLQRRPDSLPVLRSLALLVESRGRVEEATELWKRYAAVARPGDPPWYEGQYQLARLEKVVASPSVACKRLRELKPAMPGLSDVELRDRLDRLYSEVCR